MFTRTSDSRMVWLIAGVLAGMALSYFWPHEPIFAESTDRNAKFAMATASVASFAGLGDLEGVFLLDFYTGRLQGAVLNNKSGKFGYFYYRNVAADFKVDPNAEPNYAIVAGKAQLPGTGGATPANGVIYVAELTSGKVMAYWFPYRESNRALPPIQLQRLDGFQFRESLK